jgi:hypothetical protein
MPGEAGFPALPASMLAAVGEAAAPRFKPQKRTHKGTLHDRNARQQCSISGSTISPQGLVRQGRGPRPRIAERFAGLHLALVARGAGEAWRATPEARLALVIVFDQFPRNIYRGSPLAFATDGWH